MRIALITVPYASSGLPAGEARAPVVLRAAGLLDALRGAANDVVDYGDISFGAPSPTRDARSGIIAPAALTGMVFAVREAVSRVLAEERIPVVVGGECPLLLGCLAAARDARGSVGLLFVDGHEDAWPPHASTTGEAADMELGLALGHTTVPSLTDLTAMLPLVSPEDVTLLGPRDREELDAAGLASLAGSVPFYSAANVQHRGAGGLARAQAERLQASAGSWWLHLDLDVLSSDALGSVRYPQPGGLSWGELEQLASAALGTAGLAGLDLTIYNPDLDPGGHDATRIVQFVAELASWLSR